MTVCEGGGGRGARGEAEGKVGKPPSLVMRTIQEDGGGG